MTSQPGTGKSIIFFYSVWTQILIRKLLKTIFGILSFKPEPHNLLIQKHEISRGFAGICIKTIKLYHVGETCGYCTVLYSIYEIYESAWLNYKDWETPESEFVNVYGVQESIPKKRFRQHVAWQAGTANRVVVPARQAGNRFLGSLKRFTNTGSEGRGPRKKD